MSKTKSIKTDIEKYLQELNIKLPNTMSAQTSTSTPSPLKKTTKEKILEDNPDAIPSVQYAAASENRPSMPAMNPTRQSPKETAQNNAELYAKVQSNAGLPTQTSTGDAYADYINGQTSFDSDGNLVIDKQSMGAPTGTPQTRTAETTPTTTTETVETKSAEGETGNPNVLDYDTWKTTDYYAAQQQRAKDAAQEQHDIATAYANAQYGQAMEASAQAHEKALNDAMNAYALRRSTYGSQGESLGRNGLAMSGYSDYADQVAYATSRGEIAQAGANRTLAEQNAMNAYQEYLANADIAKSQADANADISFYQQMGAYQQGQDELQAKYEAALQEKQAQNFETIYNNLAENPNAYSKEQIQSLVDAGYLTPEQGNSLIGSKTTYENNVNSYLQSFDKTLDNIAKYGDPNELLSQISSSIEGAYAEESISQDVYQQLYGKLAMRYAANVDESNIEEMKSALSELRSAGKLSLEGYGDALEEIDRTIRNSLNVKKATDADWNLLASYSQEGSRSGLATATIGDDMTQLLNKYVGNENRTLVKYRGDVYICDNGKWKRYIGSNDPFSATAK